MKSSRQYFILIVLSMAVWSSTTLLAQDAAYKRFLTIAKQGVEEVETPPAEKTRILGMMARHIVADPPDDDEDGPISDPDDDTDTDKPGTGSGGGRDRDGGWGDTSDDDDDDWDDGYDYPRRGGGSGYSLDTIINLGKKIWDIIAKNKPVANVKYDFSNALPEGVKSGMELQSFTGLQFKSFRVWGTNYFGANVYNVVYTVVFRYDGNVGGKGKYLDALSIVPQKLDVAWGYTVEFKVNKVSVSNVGTREAPIASSVMEAYMKVATVLSLSEDRFLYEIRGDSEKMREYAPPGFQITKLALQK